MKIQKLFAVFIIILSLTPSALASNKSKSDKKRINKIISKQNISNEKQIELATLCLSYPIECQAKNLFQKISPNLLIANDKIFVRELLSDDANHRVLLKEALKQAALNPHLRNGNENDLALGILHIEDTELIRDLINHPRFYPNTRYGPSLYPLVSKLFIAKKIESVFMVMRHKNFSSKVADINNIRPGYHMLANSSAGFSSGCFLAFMGPNLSAWNMRGLGLNIKEHLDYLLRIVLQNNTDRLLIFNKIIRHLYLPQEGFVYDKKIHHTIKELLSYDKDFGSFAYIDKEFTYKAYALMTNYRLLTEKDEDGVLKYPCWHHRSKNDLGDINAASIKSAQCRHQVENDNDACAMCSEKTTSAKFKTSLWCDHASCADCLINYVSSLKDGQELKCPSPECIFSAPPSLLLALTTVHPDSDDEFLKLKKVYRDCRQLQKKITEETLEAIPAGCARCPKCDATIVLNINKTHKRTIACSVCKNKLVITTGKDKGPVPLTASKILDRGK